MLKRNTICTILALFLAFTFKAYASSGISKEYKWTKISGRWEKREDKGKYYLIETKAIARKWGNSELINFNSIITKKHTLNITSINLKMRILNPLRNPVEKMIFFSAKNFREFYAFKFVGNKKKIKKIVFINSKIKDSSRRITEKWNFKITEIMSKNYDLEYNKDYNIEIKIEGKKSALIINSGMALYVEAKETMSNGRLGFSIRNALLKIADVRVFSDDKCIFEDNFSEDTIKRYGAKATRINKKK
ncbi:MAG: hypothetical protein SVR08_13325 [Spirochaetota bacterium]|nr:hypothetical protein [Spirochaetota bacterium]